MRTAALRVLLLALAILVAAHPGRAQEPVAKAAPSLVPPLVKFTGTLPVSERPVLATFALYGEATGGNPLWSETQIVTVDATGRYTLLLGATTADGVPREVFAGGAARWVEVQVDGQLPMPRVLLTSVPYSLKAEDATTIAGKPLSAFVLAGETTGVGEDGLTYFNPKTLGGATAAAVPTANTGSAGYIGVFTTSVDLGNSVLFQAGSSIGLGTTTPAAPLHVLGTAAPAVFFDVVGALGALPAVYRAAHGTPAAPSAVLQDDILGGVAVRGFGTTTFGPGVGQVMFRAAEPFTDTARGTYLAMTTTPVGTDVWQERLRIDPAGNVGIGTTTPAQRLSVAGTIESMAGGFKFPDGTTQNTASVATGITYTAGAGLTLAGSQFSALFAGTGVANAVARSDHAHPAYATLGTNIFVGTQTLSTGNLAMPATTSESSGVLTLGGQPFLHAYMGNHAAGEPNTFVGLQAGNFSHVGFGRNTGVGYRSLTADTEGGFNTAVGAYSLTNNTAMYNTAVGVSSLTSNIDGNFNSALGTGSLVFNQGGSSNSAFGYSALANNMNGENNTAVGTEALYGNQAGSQNTAVGLRAGYWLTPEPNWNNTFLGYDARPEPPTSPPLFYATAIGAEARVSASHSLVLGGARGLASAVNVGIGTSAPDTTLQVVGDIKVGVDAANPGCVKNYAGNAIAGTCSSDIRLKTNIRPFAPVLDRLARLRPVHYSWKVEEFPSHHFGPGIQSGLVAQEVEQGFPEMVATDEHGYKMVNYSEVPLVAVAAISELRAEVTSVKAQNDLLEAQLAALTERLAQLERSAKLGK